MKRIGMALALGLTATTAAAQTYAGSDGVQQQTLEELKETCLRLQHDVDHGQMKPFVINVECLRERTYWAPEPSSRTLPTAMFFTGGADVKGRFVVPGDKRKTQQTDVPAECVTLAEYKVQSFKVPLTIATCAELQTVRSLPFFCAAQLASKPLDEDRPAKTGRRIETCAAPIIDPCNPGQGQGKAPGCQGQSQSPAQ